ncbi:phosphoribosylglycinamide formyltransferase [Heyndrickxia shackletonii]|uniref:Phosphoribosylglycinamide formyltransferase n=1 Tax=Heyndrickxia shackletonii TaxID=157838 RepID=A0A0Q3WRQ7_9BACI|nr:MmcQ/YjbR family DNA-binding protein [Heyndrickxia shackletonii]KQL50522.1 phosphoribosylglycinamide formyltransferase [Heyndrickxia shackletonii]NEY98172.1 MmcQ/YjbR family DNA-binding protein [Heyndrickxia shackletonii]
MESQDTVGMLENLRNICLALPEAVEHIDGFGHHTFKINGKSFVISGESDKGFRLSFKSDRETQEILIQKDHFFKAPYIGHHGWVSIQNPNEENWYELNDLIQEAYLHAAPKRLVKKWKEES